jgi:hypothetical protein
MLRLLQLLVPPDSRIRMRAARHHDENLIVIGASRDGLNATSVMNNGLTAYGGGVQRHRGPGGFFVTFAE